MFNFKFSRVTLKAFMYCILLFAVGNFLFSLHLHDSTSYINIGGIIITAIFGGIVLLATEKTIRKIFGKFDHCETNMYDDCLSEGKF